MARSQHRSKRKATGGRYHYQRTKRKSELAGFAAGTKLSTEKTLRIERVLGGNLKYRLLGATEINVADKSGKTTKTKILNVVENPANANLVRRNIVTKGCVVETSLGRARVTSRPGQEGIVNGTLVA